MYAFTFGRNLDFRIPTWGSQPIILTVKPNDLNLWRWLVAL